MQKSLVCPPQIRVREARRVYGEQRLTHEECYLQISLGNE